MSTEENVTGGAEHPDKFYPPTEVTRHGDPVNVCINSVDEATEHDPPLLGKKARGEKMSVHQRRIVESHHRIPYRHKVLLEDDDDDGEKKKRPSFCRAWCDMWFLLAQTRITCVVLTAFLLGSGVLLILLTAFGGLVHCPHLTGAAVFCILMAVLSISLGFLCCCYHWVKDDDDLPFAIFCVAYCLLLLFQFVTIAGTIVVFTHIHPIGPNQPPPYDDSTPAVSESCGMTELPLGILVICYVLAIAFVLMSYFACICALGASSDVEDD